MFTRAHLGPLALLTLLTAGAGVVLAQAPTLSAPAIVGRWDLTVHGARGDYPSWLEVWTSGNEHLVGQFVGSGGSARPVSLVEFADGKVRFSIPPQWDKRPDNETYEATLSGDTLEGWTTDRTGKRLTFNGKRAPSLARTGTPTWGDPVKLTTRSSWREAKGWTFSDDGLLASTGKAENLVSTQTSTTSLCTPNSACRKAATAASTFAAATRRRSRTAMPPSRRSITSAGFTGSWRPRGTRGVSRASGRHSISRWSAAS